MELRKTNENINRSFDEQGTSVDRVDSVNYNVLDDDGNVIGSAYVNNSNASLNLNVYGFGNVEEGEAKLKDLLGFE